MMATAGPPNTSSFLPLLETLEDVTAGQSEQTDAYLTIANRLSGEEGRQFLPAVEKNFSRLGKVILTHTNSSNAELSQAALQALGFCVYHSQVVSGVSEIFAAQILSALCSLVTKSIDKNTCTRALWVISKQSFPADVVGKNVPTLLAALEAVWNREDIQSAVMEHEALNVIIRLLEQVPTPMCDGAVRWAKLVIPLVVHSASKVRLRAAAALEMGMPLLLAKQKEVAAIIEPIMSTKLIPELQKLFMSKNETNVLKLWPLFVKLLGKLLHKGGPFINSLLHLEELGFRSSSPTIKKIAFIAWKSLIDNFALNPDILCSSKRMKLLMQPLTSIHVRTEALLLSKVEVWWYLIVQLGPNLSSNFDQVAVPLLQTTIGSDSPSVPNTPSRTAAQNGTVTPSTPKSGGSSFNTSASTPRMCLNSSMQLPASFSSIQQLGLEMLLHYFLGPEVIAASAKNKLVLSLEPLTHPLLSGAPSFMKHAAVLISTMREGFINAGKDAPEPLLAVIWTSLVRFVSLTIESAGSKKERQGSECLTLMLQALQSVVSSEALPADRVLVLLEATVKGLPPRVLGSASYQVGKMDVLNGTPALFVILLLFKSSKLPAYLEHDSRFFQCLQTLVLCGLSGPTSPLAFAEAVLGVMSSCAASLQNKELLWRMWSLLVGPLTDTITQSNEVNQGDALEHNFSATYSALMFPITHLLQQASQKSLLSSWSKLYRVFARCAALVVTAEENICCEELCVKMAAAADREALKVPSTLSAVSSILQVMVECVDFSPYTPHFQQKLKSPHTPVNWTRKRSKALGNLSAFLSLLVQSLQVYLEAPEVAPDATPLALLSIVSTLFANLVLANAVTEALGVLVQPLVLFCKRAAGGGTEFSPQLHGKLEKLLCEVLGCLQSRSTLAYDDELLALLSPLLCVMFPHKNKHLRSAVAQFWNATFANTVRLAYPEELRPVLSQMKQKTPIILPGFEVVDVPDELSETYSSESSELEPKLSGIPISSAGKRDSMLSRADLKDRSATKTAKAVPTKLDFGSPKPPRRHVLEEEASIDFVFIPPETKERVLTEHQKEVKRTKRVDIPAMYNNLDASQDTTVFSQYTQSQDDSLDKVPTEQVDGVPPEAPSETEEKPREDAEILSKETQDYASPKHDDKMKESIPDSADVFLEEPTKSTERTEDMDVESKDSVSPNTSASSDLVSGTPQKPSSRRQSFITLEKYGEGKLASPSSGSSFTGPLVKTSNSQDHSSEKNILSPEASQTSTAPNSQDPTPSETVGPRCPGSDSPRRPKESRTRSEPVRLIERMQSDLAEEEDVIPDTQTKDEDKESTSYSEEINSSSQDEESETVLDDSQSSLIQTPSGEPRRSRRHRIRPQLPGEDPDDREAKYTHVKRRRSGEDPKSESSNLTPSRPNTRSKQAAVENSSRIQLRSKSQGNADESSQSNSQVRHRKKIKLYSLSEDLLGSPERKRRSTSGLDSSQTDVKSESLSGHESQKHRKRNEVSKVLKEGGDAEMPKEGSNHTVTEGTVDLSQKDDPYPNSDSQTAVPLAQTEKSEEVKPEEQTEQGESQKEKQDVVTSSPQGEDKSQEQIDSDALMFSPVEESKGETRNLLQNQKIMQDKSIETVIDNCSQEDSQVSPSSDSQNRRRSRRTKATESEGKDDSINSSGRLTRSQTSTPVNQPEAGVGGKTRRSKLDSSQSLTPESSRPLDASGSGSSQGKGRLRSSQSSASSVETPESESSEVLVNAVRKKKGRKSRASLKSPLPLERKEDILEDTSQNSETQNNLEESLETQDSKESGSKTESKEEESESPMITETPADLPLETEDSKKAESKDASQDTKSLDTTEQRDSELESSVFGDAPAQDSCPAEEKLQTSEMSKEKAEKVSETEGVTERQEESNSDQQDFPAPSPADLSPEELQQSQMECAQVTDEEEQSATHQVSEASTKEDITLQDNEDGQPETSEDRLEEAPATKSSGAAGPDCTTAAFSPATAQDSPVKQKDLEAVTEPDVGQSPSNGRLKGAWSPSASPSTSILKKGQKRPLEVETTSPLVKSRRVSFANPIQQQETADDIDRRSPALRTSSPRRSKGCNVPQQKHITTPTKGMLVLSPRNIHSPSYRSSKKCLISEMTQEPRAVPRDCIYPSLVGCSAPVEAVLSQISSTMWSRGFGQLIRARNVKSVGDLCALTPSEIKTLPIRSPKISNVKKALKIYEQQRKGRADELKSFDETERMTSEVEEAASSRNHDDEEKTSAETLATELLDEPPPADAAAEQQDGEQQPEVAVVAADPAAELSAAVEALACRATPLELSRCSPQQLLQMHEQLGGMMRGVAVELQTRLCHASDKH
ncbi:telomere-associated protein RIF1 isoform X1 [Gambusia affinis]|uniref:telomere-associated protein RIF1 isoform X1 n=1 Tax=Gambusia affinis TaxID=33528 RepID=UPI001CDB6E0A|nr:telomere-associated protein RIF1 isoform X1 [Gambusia affinis]XP_043987026.1 telomere-associated protein RIF1 isoform X1 [Gambusia affinis]XP_043987027.1 telomere-associated protein RIF1 isoform X1 [Gambusia affinis]XP_043987028.1 telomere-associated protein RIF1 isoform X1 [Gambusia affinis]